MVGFYNNSKINPSHGDIITQKSSGSHEYSIIICFGHGEGKRLERLTPPICRQGGLHKNAKLIGNLLDIIKTKTENSENNE